MAAKNHQVMWLVYDAALLILYICVERGERKTHDLKEGVLSIMSGEVTVRSFLSDIADNM